MPSFTPSVRPVVSPQQRKKGGGGKQAHTQRKERKGTGAGGRVFSPFSCTQEGVLAAFLVGSLTDR